MLTEKWAIANDTLSVGANLVAKGASHVLHLIITAGVLRHGVMASMMITLIGVTTAGLTTERTTKMDENKRIKLQQVGYLIAPSCGFCKHVRIGGLASFGTCALFTYEHQKHSDVKRALSVHRAGLCKQYEKDDDRIALLGGFEEFVA